MTSRLVAPLAVVAVLLVAAPAAAADRFQHDLGLVDGHLRIAIEYAPAELGEALGSAELVCGLGERALTAGEADLAAADWTTLGQLVDRVAVRESRRVDVAFANADSLLGGLRERYERRWAGATVHLRELRRGVASARAGIAAVRAAVAGLMVPFDRWQAHECAAAALGVATTLGRVPAALGQINKGMLRLWRLAQLPPPRPSPPRHPVSSRSTEQGTVALSLETATVIRPFLRTHPGGPRPGRPDGPRSRLDLT